MKRDSQKYLYCLGDVFMDDYGDHQSEVSLNFFVRNVLTDFLSFYWLLHDIFSIIGERNLVLNSSWRQI